MAFTAETKGLCSKESYRKEKNKCEASIFLTVTQWKLKLEKHMLATDKPIQSKNSEYNC